MRQWIDMISQKGSCAVSGPPPTSNKDLWANQTNCYYIWIKERRGPRDSNRPFTYYGITNVLSAITILSDQSGSTTKRPQRILSNCICPTCMVEPQGCASMKSEPKTLNLCWFDGRTRSSEWCGNHWVQSWSCRLCIGKNVCQCVSWSNDCMYAHWLIIEELVNVHMKTMDSRQLTLRL
jgi:hypothetical protein